MGLLAWLLLLVGAIAFLTVVIHASHRGVRSDRDRQVLPSHYSSLLYSNPSRYPGYCPSCNSDNEPGYRICENCGSEIPTTETRSRRTDVAHIFNE